jgi:hypothetical protein
LHHVFEQTPLAALFHHTLENGYNPMIYRPPRADAGEEVLARYADGRSDAFILLYPEPRQPAAGTPVPARDPGRRDLLPRRRRAPGGQRSRRGQMRRAGASD